VDNRPPQRKQFGPRRFQPRQFPARTAGGRDTGRDQGGGAERERLRRERQQSKKQQQWNSFQGNRGFGQGPALVSSVDIRPEWAVLEQIQLSSLTKLSFGVGPPEEVSTIGSLAYFDKAVERATPKGELGLKRLPAPRPPPPSASDDPVLKRLAVEPPPPPPPVAEVVEGDAPPPPPPRPSRVFSTDTVLAALMCSPRSVYSWDIVITVGAGGDIWLDRRGGSNIEALTVNETAQEAGAPKPEPEHINSVEKLSAEATALNAAFAAQAMPAGGKRRDFDAAPDAAAADLLGLSGSSLAFRYRKWALDSSTTLYARCELNAAVEYKGEELLCFARALNEFDSKVTGIDWRQKIETQRGAVLATELKNNANKLARWTAAALLAGADQMKLGYVSRVHPREPAAHVILATQTHKPKDFASQINLNVNNMWGILKTVVDMVKALPLGRYVLVKDPSKPLVRLYDVQGDDVLGEGDDADDEDAA
jgi:translation initiation factor 3 subunit D